MRVAVPGEFDLRQPLELVLSEDQLDVHLVLHPVDTLSGRLSRLKVPRVERLALFSLERLVYRVVYGFERFFVGQ